MSPRIPRQLYIIGGGLISLFVVSTAFARLTATTTPGIAPPNADASAAEPDLTQDWTRDNQQPTGKLLPAESDSPQLRQRISELETALKAAQDAIDQLRQLRDSSPELDQARQVAAKQERQIAALKQQLSTVLQSSAEKATEKAAPAVALSTSETSPQPTVELERLTETLRRQKAREEILVEKLTKARNDLAQSQGELDGLRNNAKHGGFIEKERNTLRSDLSDSQKLISQLEATLEKKKNVEENNGFIRTQLERLTKKNAEFTSSNESLTKQSKKFSEELAALKTSTAAQTKELSTKSTELASHKAQLATLTEASSSCTSKLQETEGKVVKFSEMERALIKARNDLMLRETELRAIQNPGAPTPQRTVANPSDNPPSPARALGPQPGPLASLMAGSRMATTPATPSDVLIGEVIEDKVNLRSGPGTENSPTMQVSRGARLTIEAREGDWYRVLSPTGTRAYIKAEVVRTPNEPTAGSVPGLSKSNLAAPNLAAPNIKRTDDDTVYVPLPNKSNTPAAPAGSVKAPNAAGGPADDEARAAFESLKAQIKAARPE